jgi:hypothetical protein
MSAGGSASRISPHASSSYGQRDQGRGDFHFGYRLLGHDREPAHPDTPHQPDEQRCEKIQRTCRAPAGENLERGQRPDKGERLRSQRADHQAEG